MDWQDSLDNIDNLVFQHSGRRLSEIERAVLHGCWQDHTYEDMARATGYSVSYLNRTVAPKLFQTLSLVLGEKVTKKNFRFCIERQQFALSAPSKPALSSPIANSAVAVAVSPRSSLPMTQVDWGEAMDVSVFYGRQQEINTLTGWIESDRCRLIALLGMGGIGKTALSVKLAYQLQNQFDWVIWRSLRNAPLPEELLTDLLELLQPGPSLALPTTADKQITALLACLRQKRCLLVLDNAESVLQSGGMAGKLRKGYDAYGDLWWRLGESLHQSCVVLTSREKPDAIATLEGDTLMVRTFPLAGLEGEEAMALLQAKGLRGSDRQQQRLIQRYSGNPLALKIVATSIRDLFDGEVERFLSEGTMVFNGLRMLLERQFSRLSHLEQQVMYWLAIHREWITLAELHGDMLQVVSRPRLLEVLESLGRRSLIEASGGSFTQQPVVMEYVTEELIERICAELTSESPDLLLSHALVKACAKDYIRHSQIRLILQPVADQLRSHLPSPARIEQVFQRLLRGMRSPQAPQTPQAIAEPPIRPNYGAGNLLNLAPLLGIDLTGYDLSRLSILQADLSKTPLHQVNLTGTDFRSTVWAQSISQPLNLAFSPDGTLLGIGCQDGSVYLWQVSSNQPWQHLDAHQSWVFGIAFHPNGQMLATGSFDRTVKVWNIQTGEVAAVLTGHDDGIIDLCFSPDGRWLVSGGDCGTVKVWEMQTFTCRQTWRWQPGWVKAIAFHPHDGTCFIGSDDGTLRRWDIATGTCVQQLGPVGHQHRAIALHPTGQWVAAGGLDQHLRIWNLDTGCVQVLPGHSAIWDVAYSPDGLWLISADDAGMLCFWDAADGQLVRTVQAHQAGIWAIALDPLGHTLATASSNDLSIGLWSMVDHRCLKMLKSQLSGLYRIAYSPQLQWLASAGHNQQLELWHLEQGTCVKALLGHRHHI